MQPVVEKKKCSGFIWGFYNHDNIIVDKVLSYNIIDASSTIAMNTNYREQRIIVPDFP